MKLLLACMILAASSLRAQPGGNCKVIDCPSNFMPTPSLPSSGSSNSVAKAWADVNSAENAELIAADELKKRREAVKIILSENIPWYKPWKVITDDEIRAAMLSDSEYLRLMVKHQSAVADNYNAHNTAILEVAKAYQLFPPVRDFTGDPRAAGVNMVAKPWLPRYSRHEEHDKRTGQWRRRSVEELAEEARENAIVGGGVTAARTRGNGAMEFYDQAFASPEDLAILIYHETSHWVDIAGKSGGFQYSDPPSVSFRTEQHAYERAAAFALSIQANPNPHLKRARQFKLQADISEERKLSKAQILTDPAYRNWIETNWEGSLAIGPAEPELSPGDENLLQTKMAEAHRLVQEDREYRELMAEMKRQSDAARPAELHPVNPRAGPRGYVPAVPEVPGKGGLPTLNPHYDSTLPHLFRDIASRACSTPQKPLDQALHGVDWNQFRKQKNVDSYAEGLQACERRVVLRLIELGRVPGSRVGVDAVKAAAVEPGNGSSSGGGSVPPTQNHDPVWGKIGLPKR